MSEGIKAQPIRLDFKARSKRYSIDQKAKTGTNETTKDVSFV